MPRPAGKRGESSSSLVKDTPGLTAASACPATGRKRGSKGAITVGGGSEMYWPKAENLNSREKHVSTGSKVSMSASVQEGTRSRFTRELKELKAFEKEEQILGFLYLFSRLAAKQQMKFPHGTHRDTDQGS